MKQKINNHLVAFIDILGFTNIVGDYFNGSDTHALSLLKNAMKDAEEFAIKFSKRSLKLFNIKFTFKQFSDCVSISMPLNQKQNNNILLIYGAFINLVRSYQFILLINNIYVRGGISIGGHFENPNIIFSNALINAYKLENQNAIYPRIILDKEILNMIEKKLKELPEFVLEIFYKLNRNSIIKDWDDEIFISPFGILGEQKTLKNIFGDEEVNFIHKTYLDANNIITEEQDRITKVLNSNHDRKIQNLILQNINNFLDKNQNEKTEILNKYKWLKQFIIWTKSPTKSRIKFEHYFPKAGQKS